jgi:hypothetical protein
MIHRSSTRYFKTSTEIIHPAVMLRAVDPIDDDTEFGQSAKAVFLSALADAERLPQEQPAPGSVRNQVRFLSLKACLTGPASAGLFVAAVVDQPD